MTADAPADDFGARIAAAYASEGATVDIGRAVLDGTSYPEAVVQVPTAAVPLTEPRPRPRPLVTS